MSAPEMQAPLELPHGYYGTGSRVHGFVRTPSGGWIPICMATDQWAVLFPMSDEEIQRTDRPVNCFRCRRRTGHIHRYPGPAVRRDREEVDHLIRSTQAVFDAE
jgi:hypothetical protein